MSSLFDVPASLVVILTLAAAGGDATRLEHTIPHLDETQSLAEGPCRFTEQRWLQALDDGVGGADYRALEARVFRTTGGRYYVPEDGERRRILALRSDPAMARRIAYGLARRNADMLRPAIGRTPTAADLYVSHLFGAETAIKLIAIAEHKPRQRLAPSLAELVLLAPDLRRSQAGPATVAEAYHRLTQAFAPPSPDLRASAEASTIGAGWRGLRMGTGHAAPRAHEATAELESVARLEWVTEVYGAR